MRLTLQYPKAVDTPATSSIHARTPCFGARTRVRRRRPHCCRPLRSLRRQQREAQAVQVPRQQPQQPAQLKAQLVALHKLANRVVPAVQKISGK